MTHAILEGEDAQGRRYFLLPPPPGSREFMLAYDVVRHPDTWQDRRQGHVHGANFDAEELMRDNSSLNAAAGEPDWSDLWGREELKTCLLVSAGPSLQRSYLEIDAKAKRSDHFTLGINRAKTSRIPLDYYVVCDRTCGRDWTKDVNRKTVLIATPVAKWTVCRHFEKRYWGDAKVAGVDLGKTILATGLGITLADAMMAAYKLGAKRIELYACDFSLPYVAPAKGEDPLSGNMYHDMSVEAWASWRGDPQRRMAEFMPLRGIDGEMCWTSPKLWTQACQAEAMCRMLEGDGVEVVNRTPGGILNWGRDADEIGTCK